MPGKKKMIGIMGGSFNPIHIGHLLLADYLVQFGGLDSVWLMLSPCNPLKCGLDAAPDHHRFRMLQIACSETQGVKPCDIELSMPRPSYSIDSLRKLAELHPEAEIHLVIGSDNWLIFDRWREHQAILKEFSPIFYPRPGYPVDSTSLPEGVRLVEAPVFEISSTFLRSAIRDGHKMDPYMPAGVGDYIRGHNLYK